jgi:hypothetical protein
MRLWGLVGACVLLAVVVVGSGAVAAPPGAGSCSGGAIAAGTYNGFTVTGICTFAGGSVTIDGNLVIADGAALNDHVATKANVHVTGNVLVGKGALVGLGDYNPADNLATVDGNVVANDPTTLYLGGMTVHGNVVSNGGSGPGRNFPIKDNTIDGNLILQGWSGLWLGALRNKVGGNVIISNNTGTQTGDEAPFIGVPDSNEVVSNTIGGNLICHGNTPAAQIGDAALEGGGPNSVDGNKIGECAGL